jgi:hypothetical protein
VYDSELNGQDVTFGTSGFLYQNNKLMYDRTTRSLWHSLTGEPVVGELAESGIELERYPVTVTTWLDWLEQHPDTTVVDIDTGFKRRYLDPSEVGSAYFEYRASPDAMFPTFGVDGRLPEKSNVVGVASDGESMAFPLDTILLERVVNVTVGGSELVVLGHPLTGVLGVFERGGSVFTSGEDPREIVDESGVVWTVGDDALTAEDGRELARIPARELFWFAWAAFYPGTEVYDGG